MSSVRYSFTLWDRLTHSISPDYALASHRYVMIGLCISWLTVVSHMMLWVWHITHVMSRGFYACELFEHMTCFMGFDWITGRCVVTQRYESLKDFTLWLIMSHRDMSSLLYKRSHEDAYKYELAGLRDRIFRQPSKYPSILELKYDYLYTLYLIILYHVTRVVRRHDSDTRHRTIRIVLYKDLRS